MNHGEVHVGDDRLKDLFGKRLLSIFIAERLLHPFAEPKHQGGNICARRRPIGSHNHVVSGCPELAGHALKVIPQVLAHEIVELFN